MTQAPSPPAPSLRRTRGAAALAVALALAAGAAWLSRAGALILAERELTVGAVLVLYSLALGALAGVCAFRLLRRWLLVRAARRTRRAGEELGVWPGLREGGGRLTVRCGRPSVRFWVPSLGLIMAAAALQWLGRGSLDTAELVVSFVPGAVLALLVGAFGPSGWKLVLDGARQSLTLERFGPFRRIRDFTASLPTVQAVGFTDDGRGHTLVTVGLTRGLDWQLDVPSEWPPELGRALAARMSNLVGIEAQETEPQTAGPEPVTAMVSGPGGSQG